MAIIKNEIPLLEYDTDINAVVLPYHEHPEIKLPKKAVFPFIRDKADEYAKNHNGELVYEVKSATKLYPLWIIEYKGERVCLCQAPVGAAPAAQLLDYLYGHGVETVISGGSCGALEPIPENTFLVPVKALRDEGTSYHYQPPSRFMEVDKRATEAIKATLNENGFNAQECTTWTTDGFFRETKEKVAYRKSEGCSVVDMECSALAACAKLRGKTWGILFYTADSLANVDEYDDRDWGHDSQDACLHLCLEAVHKL